MGKKSNKRDRSESPDSTFQSNTAANRTKRQKGTPPGDFSDSPESGHSPKARRSSESALRRRVNPESLARKLGNDLVRDLDALIRPGSTDMPTFAERKSVQERHNIDRRHIYDYFHSKGLRVVKEDRHGNLTRGRAKAALEKAEKAALHGTPVASSSGSRSTSVQSSHNRSISVVRAQSPPMDPEPVVASPSHLLPTIRQSSISAPPALPTVTRQSKKTFVVTVAEETRFEVATSPPSSPTFFRPVDVVHQPQPSYASNNSSQGSSTSHSEYDDFYTHARSTMVPPSIYSFEGMYDSHFESDSIYAPILPSPSFPHYWPDASLSKPAPMSGQGAYTHAERQSFYDLVDATLPPAMGPQECVGSYKAMCEQARAREFEMLYGAGGLLRRGVRFNHLVSNGFGRDVVAHEGDESNFASWLVGEAPRLPPIQSARGGEAFIQANAEAVPFINLPPPVLSHLFQSSTPPSPFAVPAARDKEPAVYVSSTLGPAFPVAQSSVAANAAPRAPSPLKHFPLQSAASFPYPVAYHASTNVPLNYAAKPPTQRSNSGFPPLLKQQMPKILRAATTSIIPSLSSSSPQNAIPRMSTMFNVASPTRMESIMRDRARTHSFGGHLHSRMRTVSAGGH